MSVYPRSDGVYVFDYQIKRVRFYGATGSRTKRAAEDFERAHREKAKQKLATIHEQRTGPLTVNAAFDRFWMEVGDRYTGTYRDLVWSSLAWLVRELGAETLIRDIGPNRVTELIGRRRAPDKKGRMPSNATVNRSVIELLRRVLRRAETDWEQPVKPIRWGKLLLTEPKERIRELRDAEEDALFARIRSDYAPAIRFLLISGLRKRELLGLRWKDIDWTTRTIAVHGKGDKAATIPLTTEMQAILSQLRGHHPEVVFTYVSQRPRPNPRDGRTRVRGTRYPITLSGLNTAWRRHGGPAAGLQDFRLHDLRHTTATRLLRDSGNLKLVQQLLRHEDVTTTAKYAHADDNDLRTAMERASRRTLTKRRRSSAPKS